MSMNTNNENGNTDNGNDADAAIRDASHAHVPDAVDYRLLVGRLNAMEASLVALQKGFNRIQAAVQPSMSALATRSSQ